MSSTSTAQKRIRELREQLNHHNRLYHVEARPEISDRDYDRLMQELIDLETANPELVTPDSPTQRVGGEVQTALRPVKHAVPMMSIDNTYSEEEVRAFDERIRKALGEEPAYVLEPKIDGTSISLRYEKGQLVLGATRGRGNVGDDVTVNARTIKSIPLTLHKDGAKIPPPPILEVRGEVYMDNDDFQRVNKELVAEGEEAYANPRNLTAGTLRRLDPKIVSKRRLRFLAHGLGQVEPMPADSYWEWTQLLRKWGLPLPKEIWRVDNVDQAIQKLHDFEAIRPKLPYMTDGMVMKVDSFAQRDKLGATSKAPRWVIAYKYETEQQPTVLNDVRWQVGKGGNLTPVGLLEPVFIGGVTVSNVTLHNIDQIKRLDLHLGDTIIVERAGEVIPYVVEVVPEKRPKGATPVEAPKKCPSCQTPIVQLVGAPQIRCPNPDCPAQIRERMIWFAGRSQMDIDGLGEKIIDQLIERNYVRTYADFFKLTIDQLAELRHETQFGKKKATALLESIDAARPRWSQVIHELKSCGSADADLRAQMLWLAKQLALKGLGEKTIEQLIKAKLVKAPEDLLTLNVNKVAELPQSVRLGETAATEIIKQIGGSKQRGLARVLAALGIRLVGSTAARTFAEWGGDIDALMAKSVEELAAALAKNPEVKQAEAKKERAYAEELYASFHPSSRSSLFEEDDQRNVRAASASSTESFLQKRDEALSRDRRLGKSRIKRLSECLPTVAELETADEATLMDCLLEGVAVARSIFDYLHSSTGKKVIRSLRDAGVKLTEHVIQRKQSQWAGKTLVITGSFEGVSREALKDRLITLGAHVTGSVTSKTDGVFVGSDPGSKFSKAQALGVKIYGAKDVHELMASD
jgi:DNA ligase (NAD+)